MDCTSGAISEGCSRARCPDQDERRCDAVRQRHPPRGRERRRGSRPVPGSSHADSVQQARDWVELRRRLPRAARVRPGDRRRARDGKLRRGVDVVRRARAARRLRVGGVGGVAEALMVERSRRVARYVVRRDQPDPHRRAASGGVARGVPHRADERLVPRRRGNRWAVRRVVHPIVARPCHCSGRATADVYADQPVRSRRCDGLACAERDGVPGEPRRARNGRRRPDLRRTLLSHALTDRSDRQGSRSDVHRRRLVRPVPARRAVAVSASCAQRSADSVADGTVVPHVGQPRSGLARRWSAVDRRARAALDGSLRARRSRPDAQQGHRAGDGVPARLGALHALHVLAAEGHRVRAALPHRERSFRRLADRRRARGERIGRGSVGSDRGLVLTVARAMDGGGHHAGM